MSVTSRMEVREKMARKLARYPILQTQLRRSTCGYMSHRHSNSRQYGCIAAPGCDSRHRFPVSLALRDGNRIRP